MGCTKNTKTDDQHTTTTSRSCSSHSSHINTPTFLNELVSTTMTSSDKPYTSALRDAFAEFDANNDGFISRDELLNVMTSFGHEISDEELDNMIRMADSDGNGLVDFNEFLCLMDGNPPTLNVDEEMENLFSLIDTNGDGFLSEKEVRNMMKNLGEKVKKKDVRKIIKEADKNKDGKISFDEFKEMVGSGNLLGATASKGT